MKGRRNQSIVKSPVLERLARTGDRVAFIANRLEERAFLGTLHRFGYMKYLVMFQIRHKLETVCKDVQHLSERLNVLIPEAYRFLFMAIEGFGINDTV